MNLSHEQKEFVLHAESKALGSYGTHINVIPVSTVFINNNEIILCNYFMKHTPQNILHHPHVSLSCWSGTEGLQVKGKARYETEGTLFNEMNAEVFIKHPKRILQGIIIITPQEVGSTSLDLTRL